jgi:high-affinity K+ transport system ATPase subunit B
MEPEIKNDNEYWGIKVVAILNIIIIIYVLFSFFISNIVIKSHYSGSALSEITILNSLIILICTTIVLLISSIGLFVLYLKQIYAADKQLFAAISSPV